MVGQYKIQKIIIIQMKKRDFSQVNSMEIKAYAIVLR